MASLNPRYLHRPAKYPVHGALRMCPQTQCMIRRMPAALPPPSVAALGEGAVALHRWRPAASSVKPYQQCPCPSLLNQRHRKPCKARHPRRPSSIACAQASGGRKRSAPGEGLPSDSAVPSAKQHGLHAGLCGAVLLLTFHGHSAAAADALPALQSSPDLAYTLKFFAAGGTCACVSHVGGVPLDVVKTRIQTEESDKYEGQGVWGVALTIVQEEGASVLLQGLGPTFAGYFVQGSLKYGFYEVFKRSLLALPLAPPQLVLLLASAVGAEAIGSAALCPMEAVRIRMVSVPAYAGLGLRAAVARQLAAEGPGSLFASLPALYCKQIPYTAFQLASFDSLKQALFAAAPPALDVSGGGGAFAVTLAAALMASVVSSLASQPGDTLLSTLNANSFPSAASAPSPSSGGAHASPSAHATSNDQSSPSLESVSSSDETVGRQSEAVQWGGGKQVAERGSVQEVWEAARRLGPAGLMTGWEARLYHMGTIVVVQLLVYDAIKAALGLPTGH